MDEAMDQTTAGDTLPLPQLVEARLAGDPKLTDGVRTHLREALGDSADVRESRTTLAGPVYLGKVTVTGFRGVGSQARLNLRPKPGVTLVVGRNGSGKSSIAEAIETLFTGTNAHCAGQHPNRAVRWRNLHRGEQTAVEAKLAVEGDPSPSTLTRTWAGDAFSDSQAVLRRASASCQRMSLRAVRTSEKTAPSGSATVAVRPWVVSVGGRITCPPSSMTRFTASSVSATSKYVSQCAPRSRGRAWPTPWTPTTGRSFTTSVT